MEQDLRQKLLKIAKYIDTNFNEEELLELDDSFDFSLKAYSIQESKLLEEDFLDEEMLFEKVLPKAKKEKKRERRSLDDVIKEQAETFSETLLRLIDKNNLKDTEVYKKANIDRRLFSKIRSDKNYKPSKNTAIALSIALNLELDKALDLIGKAGFTLSLSSKFDLIIRYFIEEQDFNIFHINEALEAFEQPILSF